MILLYYVGLMSSPPLGGLDMTERAARRFAAAGNQILVRWFARLMDLRTIFEGDVAVTEFLADVIVGIGYCSVEGAAEALDRLLDHLVDLASEADEAVIIPGRLVRAAFSLPCEDGVRQAVGRLVRLANQDGTLCDIVHAARGPWRAWLVEFCTNERGSGHRARTALGRTLRALPGFDAPVLPNDFVPRESSRRHSSTWPLGKFSTFPT